MTRLTYDASWPGDSSAGIWPGAEEVTITFKHGQPIEDDAIEFWREVVQEFYDGSHVELIEASGRK
jgi:hypothetical protein